MMVALIALEEIESGHISLQDSVKVSRWASKIGGHQVYLKQGEIFKFSELYPRERLNKLLSVG